MTPKPNWFTLAEYEITAVTHVTVRECRPPRPVAPVIIGIKITSESGDPMAARVGTVQFQSPPPANVTSRVATVVVTPSGGAANPPITLDYVANPAASFPANDGDGYSVNAVDSDSAGPSPVSNTIAGTVAPPVSPPIAPVITGVNFV